MASADPADQAEGRLAVRFEDVQAAATAIDGRVVRTPTLHSRTLSAITGAQVWLKFENLQFTSSFKDRGALYRLLQLSADERARGVVAMSAGNHAQGLAYHATRLGIPATIVMPRPTPNVKVASTEALGATVVLEGETVAGAMAKAAELAEAHGLVPVPPFDDPHVIAAQGTVAIEMLDEVPGLEMIVVPVGGGGLIAGIAVATHTLAPQVEVIGVQSELYPSMSNAVHGDDTIPGGVTIAEGIAVPMSGTLTTPIVRTLVTDVVTVPESTIEQAMNLLLEIEKTVAEGAGAAGLAALLDQPQRFKDRRVGIVITGGNVDPRLLAQVIMRGLVRSGRLSRLSVGIDDVPGSLSRVAAVVGESGANIVEVSHQRLFSDLSAKSTDLELAVETRDRDHADRLVAALEAAGYRVTRGEHI